MKILGISYDMIISSAALLVDGKIIAAAAEERFNRQKRARVFPKEAINYCLNKAGLKIEDIDAFTFCWNPGVHMEKFHSLFSARRSVRGEYLYSIPDYIISMSKDKEIELIEQKLINKTKERKIYFLNHHLSHAALAFFLSPYKEAAILIADGRGEVRTCLFAVGKENKIEILQDIRIPHSLGSFYSTFTEFLGFKTESDEWKVMALSGFNEIDEEIINKIRNTVRLLPDGKFELDVTYYKEHIVEQGHFYTRKFVETFGEPREPDLEITLRDKKLAYAMQLVFEEVMIHMLDWLHKKTRMENLCVAGGCFMNSVFNGKITQVSKFKHAFVTSCPDDTGLSLGSALLLHHHYLGNKRNEVMKHNYFGPSFNNDDFKNAIEKYKLNNFILSKEIEKDAAIVLEEGKIVGWFQGSMEFGQRALGNRSIIADPRKPEMKDIVNAVVKYRESFRPFAAAVLVESMAEYFEFNEEGLKVDFMEKVLPIKHDKRQAIPAVAHIDGSCRLQTVSKEVSPRFYKLIEEFKKLTGVPVVLNTSFNLNGEPIVCTPKDAIRTFYSCGIDVLVMGNYIIFKNPLDTEEIKKHNLN